uniref:Uncharacterized protein n=1 Tax=Arundo donax TaxID=35708 RepID=A0A0A9A5W1_ARUDO
MSYQICVAKVVFTLQNHRERKGASMLDYGYRLQSNSPSTHYITKTTIKS